MILLVLYHNKKGVSEYSIIKVTILIILVFAEKVLDEKVLDEKVFAKKVLDEKDISLFCDFNLTKRIIGVTHMKRVNKLFYLVIMSITLVLLLVTSTKAQVVWTEISDENELPVGIKLFSGRQSSPGLVAFYAEIDLNSEEIIVHPYLSQNLRATATIAAEKGAILAVNGGFFAGTSSVSAVVEPYTVLARNIASLSRPAGTFPVTRSFLALNEDKSVSIDWIYHYSAEFEDILRFNSPTPNTTTTPAPVPLRNDGQSYENLLMGLGGGPTLVKNGEVRITYNEEVFYGSGVELTDKRPRTAVGYTSDNKMIIFIAEGGLVTSAGATLQQTAEIMVALGAVEAMNLDGGGSTTMAVNGTLFNRPSGGTFQRPVPSILAVVPSDSLKLPGTEPEVETIIVDTEMQNVTFSNGGEGWGETANPGNYGTSKARITTIGDGSRFVTYKPELNDGDHEVFGWWVASSNRAPDTPYTIYHSDGETVVRVNQQQNDGSWVSLGSYSFSGTSSDSVRISNNASTSSAGAAGTYIVADAIRFVKKETPTSIRSASETPSGISLVQNYPNPFNPTTMIEFSVDESQFVELQVFDLLGRKMADVITGMMGSGTHRVSFNAEFLSSGTYMYRLQTEKGSMTRLMTVIK